LINLLNVPWRYVGAGLVLSAVIAYVGFLNVRVSSLEATVAEKTLVIRQCDSERSALKFSIVTQNEEVSRLEVIAQEKQQQALKALTEARKQGVRVTELVGRLKASEASTCEQGILLIDEVLGL
jgi:hypothetical protein